MNPLQEIQTILEKAISPSIVEVSDMTGTMDHLEILIASDLFLNKSRMEQHQLVMDALKESLKDKVHAVKIKTMNMEKYKER